MAEPSAANPLALLVDDEQSIRRFLRSALEAEGWRIAEAATLKRGLLDAASRHPDLIILDLGLPDGDGVDFMRALRQWSSIPVIVLSARAEEGHKIKALDAGADDYLSKPFGVGELLARVRSMLRRMRQPHFDAQGVVQFGDVRVDTLQRRVSKGGVTVRLTPTEYRLLMALVGRGGGVVTNSQLLRDVWGPSHAEDGHYLRIYMGHLRQKLEDDPAQPRHLLTETAVGYRLFLQP